MFEFTTKILFYPSILTHNRSSKINTPKISKLSTMKRKPDFTTRLNIKPIQPCTYIITIHLNFDFEAFKNAF